jgi:hypothetical protein
VEVEVAEEEPSGGAAARNNAGGEPNRGGLGLATGVTAGAREHRGGVEMVEESEYRRRS